MEFIKIGSNLVLKGFPETLKLYACVFACCLLSLLSIHEGLTKMIKETETKSYEKWLKMPNIFRPEKKMKRPVFKYRNDCYRDKEENLFSVLQRQQ